MFLAWPPSAPRPLEPCLPAALLTGPEVEWPPMSLLPTEAAAPVAGAAAPAQPAMELQQRGQQQPREQCGLGAGA